MWIASVMLTCLGNNPAHDWASRELNSCSTLSSALFILFASTTYQRYGSLAGPYRNTVATTGTAYVTERFQRVGAAASVVLIARVPNDVARIQRRQGA